MLYLTPFYKFDREPILILTNSGIYCPEGDFYIDPVRKVDKALITHGHSDHARKGMNAYLSTNESVDILKERLGRNINIRGIRYGERLKIRNSWVTFYPAGHVLGSAQICVEVRGEKWVVSGDYKTEPDKTCQPFEIVQCDGFITETTFGMPIFRWEPQEVIFKEIQDWISENQKLRRLSVIYAYSLGKAQRIMHGLANCELPVERFYVHEQIAKINDIYINEGYSIPDFKIITQLTNFDKIFEERSLLITPPGTINNYLNEKRIEFNDAHASGWMATASGRKSYSTKTGFVLSDHVDWDNILITVRNTGAEKIFLTHGFEDIVARYLAEKGNIAFPLKVLTSQSYG